MSEMVKSSIFVGLALVLVAAAGYVQYSSKWSTETTTKVDKLFPNLTDPTIITGMEIVRFDEATAEVDKFEVRQVNGAWSVPSHDNYPADAENTHLAEAATALINMELMGPAVANLRGKHAEYGVVEPNRENVSTGGMGTRVVLSAADGSRLAQLIIGNQEGSTPDLRYVRVPGQDLVYIAKVDTSALTTNLEDWVEADLLKMNTFDINSIVINDYSIDEVQQARVVKDFMKLNYDSSKPTGEQWTLEEAKPGETVIEPGMENLTNALTRLQIVDVEPKPADLAAILKGEGGQTSPQAQRQLQIQLGQRGFFLQQGQLFSNEGEVIVQLNDGVVYRIQFGEVAENSGGISGLDNAVDAATTQAQQLNRYVFINAYFMPELLEKPEMPEILKEDTAEGDSTNGDAATGDTNSQVAGNQDANSGDTGNQSTASQNTTGQGDAQDQDAELAAQKRQAEIDYNAKMATYNQKVQAGQEKADELAARFADWYYIISDDVFNEIKVNRTEIINAIDDSYNLDDLQKLQREGIRGGM